MTKSKKMLAIVPAIALVAASCGGSSDGGSADGSDDTVAESGDTGEEESGDTGEEESGDTGEEESGDTGAEEVDQTQAGDLTFHMITHSDDGPFWSVLKRGADQAAADLGVTLVWKPGNNDAQVMVQDIEAAVAEGSNGIGASLPDPDALVGPLTSAVDGGVPVITLNSGLNSYQDIGALTHVGQTEIIAGNGAGERFNEAGTTKILCGQQEQGNVALNFRVPAADCIDNNVGTAP